MAIAAEKINLDFTVRRAEESDLPAIVAMGAGLVSESRYTDEPADFKRLFSYFSMFGDDEKPLFIAEGLGHPMGFASCALSWEFSDTPFAYIVKFYVLPRARKTEVGRNLAQAVIDWARESGASHLFATSTANINDETTALFSNLFKRKGFKELGPALMMDIRHE